MHVIEFMLAFISNLNKVIQLDCSMITWKFKTRGPRGPHRSPEYIKYSIRRFFKKSVRILHRRESKTEEIRAKYMNDNQYESVPSIQKSILFAR